MSSFESDSFAIMSGKNSSQGVVVMQTQPAITEHLSPELANLFLAGLPEKIR
jgi:hypothetical protein